MAIVGIYFSTRRCYFQVGEKRMNSYGLINCNCADAWQVKKEHTLMIQEECKQPQDDHRSYLEIS
jgi:hypothetical protein